MADLKIFEMTGARLVDAGLVEFERATYQVEKMYHFTSKLKRMSVVARREDTSASQPVFYIKGAPEVVMDLCIPSKALNNAQE
jgi:magnesium-transporting ATPase (P-type)